MPLSSVALRELRHHLAAEPAAQFAAIAALLVDQRGARAGLV
ncbi:hypothetical protein P4118_21475 [Pseudomonas aeruginosa]|nr:hypothetical protein [Pseudomonas aeruginosa]